MSQTSSNGGGAAGSGSGQIVNRAELRERRITVHMTGQDGTRLTFTIRHKVKLSVLFHNYCRRKQFDYRTARFFHEGRRVLGKYSAAQVTFLLIFHSSNLLNGYKWSILSRKKEFTETDNHIFLWNFTLMAQSYVLGLVFIFFLHARENPVMVLAMESSSKILSYCLILLSFILVAVNGQFPKTLEGPFEPMTVPVDYAIVGKVTSLPVNKSPLLRPKIGFQPEQISLSFFKLELGLGFMDRRTIGSSKGRRCCSIRVYGSDRNNRAIGTSFIYSQQYPNGRLENYTSGIIHRVLIAVSVVLPVSYCGWNLILYEYQCGDPNKTMNDVHYFRTMPSTPEDYPSRIAVVGGLGLTYNTSTAISHMVANHPDLALLVGDLKGEHEIEKQADNQTFTAYSSRFASACDESGSTLYYSFGAGVIHFVMLGAYVPHDKSSGQYKWLERDLSIVNRSVTPWFIAAWSPPWSNRVYNYTLDPCGPVHISVGSGGNEKNLAVEHADEPGNCPVPSNITDGFKGSFCGFNFTSDPVSGNFCWNKQPEYSAYKASSFGYGILEVKSQTHALWIWYRNQDRNSSGADIIYIERQPDRCPGSSEGFCENHERRSIPYPNSNPNIYIRRYNLYSMPLCCSDSFSGHRGVAEGVQGG
ncbi:Carbohydrate-binding X8 domain superfamily protein isoform 1 [Hibiscus syriacus]|uniref:Carbohydrate-binding X8 domain superfamily protein isoform 1 n=1 Tax=Hibiscus syriacus TaxID=106335 RepID=A0A6A3C3D8_HIBSY|nr:Carbohydrate-binding X8 domain superfamily protein isoform 1 [Hibiscus syriacus]